MTTLTLRPYSGEADLHPIAELLNRCETVDQIGNWWSLDELRHELDGPDVDQGRDICLVEEANGALIGFAMLWHRHQSERANAGVWFNVDPAARGGDVAVQLLEWAEECMREIGRERGVGAVVGARPRVDETERIEALRRRGFTIARYYLEMGRPLDEPISEPQLPTGFALRHLAGKEEVAAWLEAYHQSFIDHYDHHHMTVEQRLHWMSFSDYRLERDLVAIAPDGTVAAFCWCGIHPEENAHSGRSDGWIHILGTRRGFRKIGLGRAMLLAGLRALKAEGATTALLNVDADSPTGAGRLYESAGFRPLHTFVQYRKEL